MQEEEIVRILFSYQKYVGVGAGASLVAREHLDLIGDLCKRK